MSYTDQDFETTAASHTPGPWVVNDRFYVCTAAPTPEFIADCATDSSVEREYAIDEANARLIAAAPDLLAACKKADESIVQLCRMICVLSGGNSKKARAVDFAEAVRDAIAKAEGR